MSELENYRKKIDEIDQQLTRLFEERMDTVLKVGQYKLDNNLPVFHKDREEQVIEKNIGYLRNKEYSDGLRRFYNITMNVSKDLQRKKITEVKEKKQELNLEKRLHEGELTVGFYGVQGSFSEEAMMEYFGSVGKACNFEEFEDVFLAVKNDVVEYGVLPIENSSTGAISQVYDLLSKYGFYIVGEQYIKINQHLIGHAGTDLEQVKEVYSHPQGFEQTNKFLRKYSNWKMIPFHSTADSVRLVKELNDSSKVAIASSRAAEIYDLQILKRNINNKSENSTRFIVISKKLHVGPTSNKVSVVFSLEHTAGTLYHLLRHFAENEINMMKIESRPAEDGKWKYILYVDFEGNIQSEKVKKALNLIEESCQFFRLLGCYQQDQNI